MNVRLFEIFTSVEGEGILYGTKTLFVRLAGCPFKCFYCDTPDALPPDSGEQYTVKDACKMIEKKLEPNTYKVNFTGGDPLVQSDALAEMARFVQSKKIPTYIESSCYDSEKFARVIPFIDYVKIEFKTEDSEFVEAAHYPRLFQNAIECLKTSLEQKKHTYVKIVVSSRTGTDSFGRMVDSIFRVASGRDIAGFVIQPTHGIAEPSLKLLLGLYDLVWPLYREVRIVPQLHKIIGAP